MKPDRRTLLVGAVVIAALAALNTREARRSACGGGSCFLPLPGLSGSSSSFCATPGTNQPPVLTPVQTPTNRSP